MNKTQDGSSVMQSQLAIINAELQRGTSLRVLAKARFVSVLALKQWLREAGHYTLNSAPDSVPELIPPWDEARSDAEQTARMYKRFRSGETLAVIGRTFGVTPEEVRSHLQQSGHYVMVTNKGKYTAPSPQPARGEKSERRLAIEALAKSGRTASSVAAELGCSTSRVSFIWVQKRKQEENNL